MNFHNCHVTIESVTNHNDSHAGGSSSSTAYPRTPNLRTGSVQCTTQQEQDNAVDVVPAEIRKFFKNGTTATYGDLFERFSQYISNPQCEIMRQLQEEGYVIGTVLTPQKNRTNLYGDPASQQDETTPDGTVVTGEKVEDRGQEEEADHKQAQLAASRSEQETVRRSVWTYLVWVAVVLVTIGYVDFGVWLSHADSGENNGTAVNRRSPATDSSSEGQGRSAYNTGNAGPNVDDEEEVAFLNDAPHHNAGNSSEGTPIGGELDSQRPENNNYDTIGSDCGPLFLLGRTMAVTSVGSFPAVWEERGDKMSLWNWTEVVPTTGICPRRTWFVPLEKEAAEKKMRSRSRVLVRVTILACPLIEHEPSEGRDADMWLQPVVGEADDPTQERFRIGLAPHWGIIGDADCADLAVRSPHFLAAAETAQRQVYEKYLLGGQAYEKSSVVYTNPQTTPLLLSQHRVHWLSASQGIHQLPEMAVASLDRTGSQNAVEPSLHSGAKAEVQAGGADHNANIIPYRCL